MSRRYFIAGIDFPNADIGIMGADKFFNEKGPKLVAPGGKEDLENYPSSDRRTYTRFAVSSQANMMVSVGGEIVAMGSTIPAGAEVKVVMKSQTTSSQIIVLDGEIEQYSAKQQWMRHFQKQIYNIYQNDKISRKRMKYMIDTVIVAKCGMIISNFSKNPFKDLEFTAKGAPEGVVNISTIIKLAREHGAGLHAEMSFENDPRVVLFGCVKVDWQFILQRFEFEPFFSFSACFMSDLLIHNLEDTSEDKIGEVVEGFKGFIIVSHSSKGLRIEEYSNEQNDLE